ncbi:MAG: Ig-like domain-containing protein [Propionibacteriales bacterium]|nr:Ig-like domain-containing protein [Propionibacteriales bacterium]
MKTRLRKPWAVVAGLALFATTAAAGAAFAAGFTGDPDALAWYSADETTVTANPDRSATPLKFYDAAGAEITSGLVAAKPFVPYASVDGDLRAGDTHASLFAYTANPSLVQGAWTGSQLTGANAYPVSGAPGVIGADPAVKGTAGSESLADYIAAYPNTSSATGFAGVYEIRLRTGNAKGVGTTYASTYIKVTGSSWAIAASPVNLTPSTTASVVPTKARYGTAFNVSATVTVAGTPSPTGTVSVFKGATLLASKALTSTGLGKATITVPGTKLVPGTSALTVKYGGTGTIAASQAAPKNVVVSKAISTTVGKIYATPIRKAVAPRIIVTVKAAGVLKPTGTIRIYVGSKLLKTVTLTAATNGKITITLPKFRAAGTYRLVAKYAGSSLVGASNAAPVSIKVTN